MTPREARPWLGAGAALLVVSGAAAVGPTVTGAGVATGRSAAASRAVPATSARPAGAPLATAPSRAACPRRPLAPGRLIRRRTWLTGVAVTEYYSTPERWFTGRRVVAPGLRGTHRVDWLYSARGLAMEGDGIGLDGRHYHIDALGSGGWVNTRGRRTKPGRCASRWSHGRPAWLEGGWRNAAGAVTFPLPAGAWSSGRPVGAARSYRGVTFAAGSSLPLTPYRTLAVDPRLIPRGSRVYIPAYRRHGGGWFVARDTGGAIIGRHVDVYRPPPATPLAGGRFLEHQRILVVPPRRKDRHAH